MDHILISANFWSVSPWYLCKFCAGWCYYAGRTIIVHNYSLMRPTGRYLKWNSIGLWPRSYQQWLVVTPVFGVGAVIHSVFQLGRCSMSVESYLNRINALYYMILVEFRRTSNGFTTFPKWELQTITGLTGLYTVQWFMKDLDGWRNRSNAY